VSGGRLSPLQRRILKALAGLSPPWTLTGGGALVGFHLGHRETRDLDLFWRSRAELGQLVAEALDGLRALRTAHTFMAGCSRLQRPRILIPEAEEAFERTPIQREEIEESIAHIDRGEWVGGWKLLDEVRGIRGASAACPHLPGAPLHPAEGSGWAALEGPNVGERRGHGPHGARVLPGGLALQVLHPYGVLDVGSCG
jgi:hypothetical protein